MSNEALVRSFAFETLYAKQESVFKDSVERPPPSCLVRREGAPVFPLPEQLPELGSVGEAFAGLAGPARQVEAPRLSKVGALLAYSLGLLRRELLHHYNNHRAVPSPRCLYPSDLYLWLPGGEDLSEGLYHYLPAEHALELVRPGGRAWLEASLGARLEGVEAVALPSLEFWRVCYRYGEFGYRLCMLEAGHLVGNLLLLGGALGWEGQVRYQFVDEWLHEALGLTRGELCAGAVLLGRRLPEALDSVQSPPRPPSLEPLQGRRYASEEEKALQQLARLWAAAQASHMQGPGEFRRPGPPQGVGSGPHRHLAGVEGLYTRSLAQALYERNSGFSQNGLAPLPVPLPGRLVREALVAGLSPYRHDSGPLPYARPFMDIHTVALRVEGLETGIHRFHPGTGEVQLFQSGVDAFQLHKTYLVPERVNVSAHGLVWFLSADVEAAFARWGARAYRTLLMEAGLVTQWLSVCVSTKDVFARASLSYTELPVERMLGLTGGTSSVVYQLLTGTTRMYGMRLDLRPWS